MSISTAGSVHPHIVTVAGTGTFGVAGTSADIHVGDGTVGSGWGAVTVDSNGRVAHYPPRDEAEDIARYISKREADEPGFAKRVTEALAKPRPSGNPDPGGLY